MAEVIASAALDGILHTVFHCCSLGDVQQDLAEFSSELATVKESIENIATRNVKEINIELQMWLARVSKFLQDTQQLGEDLSKTRKLPRSLNCVDRFRLRRLVKKNLDMAIRLMLSVDYSGWGLINQELYPDPWFSDVQAESGKEVLQNYELAYKNLPQDTRSLLLLCPLFPKNHKISVGELTRFAVGLQMLEGIDSLVTARERIREMAMALQDSGLLSYAGEEQFVMIPDAVSDFVHRMASEGADVCLKPGLGLTEWPDEGALQCCTSISLMNNKIKNLVPASGFECPKLKCLLLAGNDLMSVSGTSFQKLESLKLLTVGGNIISVEGFHSLTSLRSLHMEKCKLNDSIQKLGHLKHLEILSFSGSDIQELPNELGYLENLKLLDLSDCKQLQRVPANLIPKWSKLEELYIGNFRKWSKEEEDESNDAMASVAELLMLPHLDVLYVAAYPTCFPRDFVFPELRSYQIVVHGDEVCNDDNLIPTTSAARSISTFGLDPLRLDPLRVLFHNVEYLSLKDIKGLQNLFPWLDKLALTALKFIEIQDCKDFECLVDATGLEAATSFSNLQHLELKNLPELKCIWKGLSPHVSLDLQHLEILKLQNCNNLKQIFEVNEASNNISLNAPPMPVCLQSLTTLEISYCHSIVSTFRASAADGLPELKSLEVSDCTKLEEIFGWGDTCVKLPQLQRIVLQNLINLSRICRTSTFVMPILQMLHVENCPNLGPSDVEVRSTEEEEKPAARFEELYLIGEVRRGANECGDSSIGSSAPFRFPVGYLYTNLKYLVLYSLPLLELWKDPTQIVSLQNLMYLRVNNCPKLRCIFTVTISQNLPKLMYLEIYGCDELKQIIEKDDMLSSEAQRICFPKLTDLHVTNCNKLTSLFPINLARLVRLKRISVTWPKELTHVFQGKTVDERFEMEIEFPQLEPRYEKEIELPQLEELILENLPELIAFSPGGFDFIFPSLKRPCVKDCRMMTTRFEDLNGVWHARTRVSRVIGAPAYAGGNKGEGGGVRRIRLQKRLRACDSKSKEVKSSAADWDSTSIEEEHGSLQPPHPAPNFIPYSVVHRPDLDLGLTYNYKPYQPPANFYENPSNQNACVIC